MNSRTIFLFNIAILFVLFCADPISAKPTIHSQVNYGGVIKDIRYVGLKNVNLKDLPSKADLYSKVGHTVKKNNLVKDINQIYLTGFFNEVKAETVPSFNSVVLVFVVKENSKITDILFNGNTLFNNDLLKRQISSKPGDIVNIKKFKKDISALEKYYHLKGYTLFNCHNILLLDEGKVFYELSEGNIADISIDGLTTLKPSVVLRNLILKNGSVFNALTLKEDREKLLRLGYFSDVFIPRLDESLDKQNVRLTYKVTEKKVNLLDFGVEQEDEYVFGFVQSEINHVLQQTDILSGKIQFSYDENMLNIVSYYGRYTQPWFLNKVPMSFSVGLWDEYRYEFLTSDIHNTNIFRNRRYGGNINLGFPIILERLNFMTSYKGENVAPLDDSLSKYTISSFSGKLSFQSISNWNNPKKGAYWSVEVEKGGDLGIFDLNGIDFTRYNLNYAIFFKISEKSVLGFHTSMGVFKPKDGNLNTFEAEGYELGGSNSLRGYKETSPLVGEQKVLYNLEYRYDFSKVLQGVLFYDIGNVFDNNFKLIDQDFPQSFGFGIRFFTPIGPIRTDFAFGKDFIFHFGLGQLF
jgi:outer membrane protein insertion porin family